jgi:hypothetical protein
MTIKIEKVAAKPGQSLAQEEPVQPEYRARFDLIKAELMTTLGGDHDEEFINEVARQRLQAQLDSEQN